MLVEPFDHTVPPWFRKWDEPGLDTVVQAQPDQGTHSTRVSSTAVEGRLVIDLEVYRDAHAVPDTP